MLQTAMDSKTIRVVYAMVFPVVMVILLLGVASINNRQRIFGSIASDFVIRCLLTIWFCILYMRLSRISTFSYYPNKKWTKADVGPLEKYYYWAMSVFFSVVCGIITWWIMRWFFLSPPGLTYAVSIANCLIILLPLVTHYWVLKL